MANAKVIDRTGKGAALDTAEYDSNVSSLSGVNEVQAGTSHTIDINDQNKTIDYTNAGTKTITLTILSTIATALHTDDFRVILTNNGAGAATINTNAADTFNDTSTSIVLAQYETIELQTTSTSTIWNVIRRSRLGSLIDLIYPVGSVYISTIATNPGTIFGAGTWVATGVGSVLIGVGTSDAVYALDDTGGESTHTLSTAEMPSHNHGGGAHTHGIIFKNNTVGAGSTSLQGNADTGNDSTVTAGASPTVIDSQGSGNAHENMPPYLVVHMWERTA